MSKTKNFNIRITDEMRARFTEVVEKDGKRQGDIVIELMKAAIRYFERNGNLYPPFELIPGERTTNGVYGEETIKSVRLVAEKRSHYGGRKRLK